MTRRLRFSHQLRPIALRHLGRVCVPLAVLASCIAFPARSLAQPQFAGITVTGTVFSQSGGVVPGATVRINGVTAAAGSSGHYSLQTSNEAKSIALVWAPGYTETIQSIDLSQVTGTVIVDFKGGLGLQPAFSNPSLGATLSNIPAQLPPGTRKVSFHGTSRFPLLATFGVTLPSGKVKRIRLKHAGNRFHGTFATTSNGPYRLEILTAGTAPVFNLLVFRGVAPDYPSDPSLPADPANASVSAVSAFLLRLMNIARADAGRPPFTSSSTLVRAAQQHTVDMVKFGYLFQHPHVGSDGSTVAQRVKRAGGNYRGVAEDIGRATIMRMLMLEWLHSPLHRANIIGPYTAIGIGVVRSGGALYVTVDFGR